MAYPQGYLYQPSASLALYSCPAYSAGVISGPRTEELGRSSSGSAFAPYAGSAAFTGATPGYGSHLPYAADAAAAAATFSSYVVSERIIVHLFTVQPDPGGSGLNAVDPPPALSQLFRMFYLRQFRGGCVNI